MPYAKEHIILHHFVQTIEHDVLIPLFLDGKLNSYVKTEELSSKCPRNLGYRNSIMGIAVTCDGIVGISYFGFTKKSIGLLGSPESIHKTPVMQYHKLPENLVRTYLKNKTTAINITTLNKKLQTFIQGNNYGSSKNSVGEETIFHRERRIFEGMLTAGDTSRLFDGVYSL